MRYDTNQKDRIEPGIYEVTVSAYPQEKTVGGGFVKIDMEFSIEGQERPIKQSFFPNQLSTMFVALGFKEVEPGIYDGDIQEAFQRTFNAELFFEEYDKKDTSGAVIGKGKARRLRNFTVVQMANKPVSKKTPEEITWEE
jgi:hypothetical protein